MDRYTTPEELRIVLAGIFSTRAVGRANALKIRQLEALLPDYSNRVIRAAMAELATVDRVPIIGDSGAGYYRPESLREVYAYRRQAGRKIASEALRLRTVCRSAEAGLAAQPELDFDATPEEAHWYDCLEALLADMPASLRTELGADGPACGPA